MTLLLLSGCEQLPTGPAEFREQSLRGVTFVDWTPDGYGEPGSLLAIQDLAGSGANQIWILVTGYQSTASANQVVSDAQRTPTFESVQHAMTEAQRLGLEVALKVHVDVHDGTWRGAIEPTSVELWFQSYREFLLPWATFAADHGAAHFVVGTELASTIVHEAFWRETIRAVRQRFSGALTYAASWDEAHRIGFWDALDLVGINAYFPVAGRNNPSRFELLAGWQVWLDRMHRLHRQARRPILLTEIGYRSVDGAGMEPYRFDHEGVVDVQEQADLYWAALQATGSEAWLSGVVWWNWLARDSGEAAARDYTPADKPALLELRAAWRDLSKEGP